MKNLLLKLNKLINNYLSFIIKTPVQQNITYKHELTLVNKFKNKYDSYMDNLEITGTEPIEYWISKDKFFTSIIIDQIF